MMFAVTFMGVSKLEESIILGKCEAPEEEVEEIGVEACCKIEEEEEDDVELLSLVVDKIGIEFIWVLL